MAELSFLAACQIRRVERSLKDRAGMRFAFDEDVSWLRFRVQMPGLSSTLSLSLTNLHRFLHSQHFNFGGDAQVFCLQNFC
jgi:hypothetical protein